MPEQDSPLILDIDGMTCASCSTRLERVLGKVEGVEAANVNLATEKATITGSAGVEQLLAAVKKAGFEVRPAAPVELTIEGMTCASCSGRLERVLGKQAGVTAASVNLATEKAHIEILPGTRTEDLIAAVRKAGFDAKPLQQQSAGQSSIATSNKRDDEARLYRRDLLIAAILTVPVFILEMGGHLVPSFHHWVNQTIGQQTSWLLQFVLTSLVLLGPGLRFYKKGLPALLHTAPDMNSLVAVGTLAAWGFSTIATFLPQLLPAGTVHVYFEAAAVIVTLILLGRLLEARAKGQTSSAIKHLVSLRPQTARIVRDGQLIETQLAEVVNGNLLEIRPGERIPVDGEVVEGSSYVDESMITGEPIPAQRQPGDTLVGGTLNQTGALTMRATAVGEDSVLSRIIQLVEQAQGSKLPIQTLVDRVTLWFVPAVMGLATLTFVIWLIFGPDPALTFALVNAVAVLIVACPCAMGLATPTSIMVGTGRGAEAGVLFRKGEALQRLESSAMVVFDKTGTLTEGKPALTDLHSHGQFDSQQVLAAIAALELKSEHPIARAIVTAAEQQQLTLPTLLSFNSLTGMGVEGQLQADGESFQLLLGADRLMQQQGIDISPLQQTAEQLAQQGKTPLYAAVNHQLAAVLAVADPIKETTPTAIQALHAMGLQVAMVTGDNQHTANAIARQLGIDQVVAEVMPAGKVDAIKQLKQSLSSEQQLVFVGDGINDAPALAAADAGMAIGTGTDVAIESADVVLMSGSLQGVVTAISLSQATMRNIRQNLFWAFAYNSALVPLAAGVFYPAFGLLLSPALAAGAMAMSSVFVVGNALRLRRISL
ncbi:heavy metal translocating P-type ATPase [Oceanobacter mangrovi]|uniref:heavy metal translocating P-type ATPase n=1 Tax=Oceanobacter mangrovi TaxID=2862510 RepID=UPI001FE7FEF2|nr:heavy metal translocating P-type ATPase [Oceanobacter mangrovi]